MAFQGSLKELPLPDIIQLVSVSGKTGKFTLAKGSERGFIYLKDGQMTHAEVGKLTGEEAVYMLAIWTQGEFQFSPSEEPVGPTITKSNTNLLMEAARRLDEWRVLSKKIASVDLVPVLKPRENRREPITLDPQEWLVVTKVDGVRSIEEVGVTLKLSAFEVAKILYGMITSEIVELKKKTEPIVSDAAPHSDLIALADQVRGIAEQHLGVSGHKAIEKYYMIAVNGIHKGEGFDAVRSMITEIEKAAAIVAGAAVTSQMKAEISSLASD